MLSGFLASDRNRIACATSPECRQPVLAVGAAVVGAAVVEAAVV